MAGSKSLVDGLINFSRSFIYSTALPPSAAAAGTASLKLVTSREGERRRSALHANAGKIIARLKNLGYDLKNVRSHIVPVFAGDIQRIELGVEFLLEMGVFVPAIRPPTVPRGASRFRLSVMSDHTDDDLQKVADAFAKLRDL